MAAIVQSNKTNSENFVVGTVSPVIPIAAATTLTAAHSGSLFPVTANAVAYTITLPAPTTAGMRFRFYQAVNAAGATSLTSTGVNVKFRGLLNITAGCTAVNSVGCTTINIIGNSASSVGDWVELVSDGTSYFATGQAALAGGFTVA